MKREVAELKNGERLLIGICMAGSYDETSNTIKGFKFPEFTDVMEKALLSASLPSSDDVEIASEPDGLSPCGGSANSVPG